jgi:hypothetical protein
MSEVSRQLSNELIFALETLCDVLPAHQAKFALIGGLATGIRSRLRLTEDIDLIINVQAICLPPLLEDLRGRGFDFELMKVTREWSQNQLVVLQYKDIRIDWLKPMVPAYQHVLDTARIEKWHDREIPVATPEGIILTKLIAARMLDFTDITELLAANQGQLDLNWIEQEWLSLFTLDDPRWHQFKKLIAEYYQRKSAT